nr:SHOCT domain-containing protein [uncultured Chryseobacterium sp.]
MKYSILILISIISCQKKQKFDIVKNNNTVVTMSQITTDYDTLIKKVKYKGDIDAYDELFTSFMDSNELERTDSLMKYSKIMAEKYNYENAYFDYFDALLRKNEVTNYDSFYHADISKVPPASKKQAENWLKKMLEKKIITQEEYNSVKK